MSVGALRSPPKYSPFFGFSASAEPITDVTNIWSPQTAGELQPVPGISLVHATFSVALHLSGRLGSSATPNDPGPRNPGQLSLAVAPVSKMAMKSAARINLLTISVLHWIAKALSDPANTQASVDRRVYLTARLPMQYRY